MSRILETDELASTARGVAARPELWRPHVRADAELRHCHRLVAEPHLTVWLICWMPGHDTGFHDHDGAAGAVAVVSGAVREERLRYAAPPVATVHSAGDVLHFGPDEIHRVAHAAGEPAVTIHAYSPELRRMGAYVEGPEGILLRRAQDETVQLAA
jgi:predicted metal-dependent enzyme (double-stranded beta helix superfamily)